MQLGCLILNIQRGVRRILDFIARYWLEVLFGLIVTALTFLVRRLFRHVSRNRQETSLVREGIKCMLRDRIIQNYEQYINLEYCPLNVRENLEDMHSAYKALGGNGAVGHIMEELNTLPTIKRRE